MLFVERAERAEREKERERGKERGRGEERKRKYSKDLGVQFFCSTYLKGALNYPIFTFLFLLYTQ